MKQTMQRCWEAYRSNNPCVSVYMEDDYRAGFEDAWKAKNPDLRAQAAVAAMNAFIRKGDGSSEHYAKMAVRCADALIRELKGNG